MLDNKLIESALGLTGKSMEDMEIVLPRTMLPKIFSIEKFCYYLLSPEFIMKYSDMQELLYCESTALLGQAIYEYQSGNEQPLIKLLQEIGA